MKKFLWCHSQLGHLPMIFSANLTDRQTRAKPLSESLPGDSEQTEKWQQVQWRKDRDRQVRTGELTVKDRWSWTNQWGNGTNMLQFTLYICGSVSNINSTPKRSGGLIHGERDSQTIERFIIWRSSSLSCLTKGQVLCMCQLKIRFKVYKSWSPTWRISAYLLSNQRKVSNLVLSKYNRICCQHLYSSYKNQNGIKLHLVTSLVLCNHQDSYLAKV